MKWYRINALLLKYWYVSTNRIDRVFDIFYWPLIGLIVFGFTTTYIEKISNFPDIVVFFLGGLILWTILERVQQDVTVYILEDFWSRNVSRTFVTPLKESELFISVALLGVFRAIISFTSMFILAFVAYKFNMFSGGILSILFVIPLIIFGWAVGIFISGLVFRFGTRIQVFSWSISYLMQPLAAMFYPIETLPIILQKIAVFLPLAHTFGGFRTSYSGGFAVGQFLIATALAFVYLIIGYVSFVYSIKSSKKSGMLTKY